MSNKIYQVGLFQTMDSLRAIKRASENAKKQRGQQVVLLNGAPFVTVQKNGKVVKH